MKFCDVSWQYGECRERIDRAVLDVLSSGNYILGSATAKLEKEMVEFLSPSSLWRAFGVANGTDALVLSLMSHRIGPGDRVIVPSFTFVATAHAVSRVGAEPVFVDVDEETYTISPESCEWPTERVKAVIPVHFYGHPANMDAVSKWAYRNGAVVIEDCAQATGAKYNGKSVGVLGDAGCFSFFPTKTLGCCGDGGMIVVRDGDLADRVDMLRKQGARAKNRAEEVGLNSRLDELQSTILSAKLSCLNRWNVMRRELASRYDALLGGLPVVIPNAMSWAEHVYHLYVLRVPRRDAMMEHLLKSGVPAMVHYQVAVHQQPYYAARFHAKLPVTEKLCDEIVSLPFYPGMKPEEQRVVADAVASFF